MEFLNNFTFLNQTQLSILLTPEYFMFFYSQLYRFDKTISKARDAAFFISVIFMLVGFLGNLISIYVFQKRNIRRNKFNWYLLVVSILRLLFCMIVFIDYIFSKVYVEEIFLHDLNKISSLIIDFILHTSDSCVVILTVFLSLDRLYAIKQPMKINEFMTHFHAKRVIISSLVTVIILKIASFVLCELNVEGSYHIIFCTVISPTLFNTVPLIIILILNTLLVIAVIKYYRAQSKQKSTDEKSLASTSFNSKERIQLKKLVLKEEITESKSISIRNFRSFGSTNTTTSSSIRNKNRKKMTRTQKSHYLIILVTDIWSVITSFPYYTLNSFFVLFQLNIFNIENLIMLQIVFSILFNSNQCISFFIYLSFYNDFRIVVNELFLKCICKRSIRVLTIV
jgi:hypothetical protein